MRHPQTETHTGGGVFWGAHTPDKNLLVSRAPPPLETNLRMKKWPSHQWHIHLQYVCKIRKHLLSKYFHFCTFLGVFWFCIPVGGKSTDETVPTIYRICLGHFYIPKFVSRGWGFRIKIICPCWYIKLKRRANVYLEKKLILLCVITE